MPTENVLAILTMRIKMYALSATCSTSPLFNLDVFIFAEDIQKHVIDKHGFVLAMEISYLNLGVTSEILNRLILVMSAVTTYNVFIQKHYPTADRVQNESGTELR